ncbi:MliC family protein [Pantanalinema rosaneae CENA516]|uniref:MliC family protein n=1 Tax=Pantanalinema rosaneae TaxID=1620701 RepID=UPI003D6F4234
MHKLISSVLGVLTVSVGLTVFSAPVSSQNTTRVWYRCDANKGFYAVYRPDGSDSVRLTFGSKVITLPQVESASGARYSNGSVTLNTKGDEAFVEVGDKVLFDNCVAQQGGGVSGLW